MARGLFNGVFTKEQRYSLVAASLGMNPSMPEDFPTTDFDRILDECESFAQLRFTEIVTQWLAASRFQPSRPFWAPKIKTDVSLARGTLELRDEDGKVLARFVNVSTK